MEKRNLLDLLKGNPYPGRGIVLGKSGDGKQAVAVYFIMGRSENSRNRVFVPTEDGIRTEARDPSKMTDPKGRRRADCHQRGPDGHGPGLSPGGPHLCQGAEKPRLRAGRAQLHPPHLRPFKPRRQLSALHFEKR